MSGSKVSHQLSVVIGAALSSGFNSTISGSTSKIGQIGTAIKDMEKQSTLSARTLDNLKTRYNSFLGSLNKQQAVIQKRSFYRSQIMDMVALGSALAAPINIARKFNSHLSKLKRIFNFSDSDGHKKFGTVLTEMSLKLPVAIDDLGKLAVVGGRFGVSLEDLPGYVENVAKASKVWGMEAEEAGEKVGNFMKTFGVKAPDVSKYFDVITRLGRDTGRTADEILSSVIKAGDGLANFKLSIPQVAALTSTIMSFGEGSEQAGTLVTGMLQKLSIAPKLGAKAQKALRSIGLSAKVIPHMLDKDPQKVLDKLFNGLSKLSTAQRGIALYEIFGRGPSKMVGKLIDNLGVYRENLNKAKEENSAGYFEKDWQSIAKGTGSGITLLTNNLSSFGLQIGMVLLPTVKKLCHGLSEVLRPITKFMNENKELTSVIVHSVAGFISLRIATFGLGYAATFLFGGVNKLVIIFKGLRLGLALAGAAFRSFFKVGPLAFIGIAWILYENWENVKSCFSTIWDAVEPHWLKFKSLLDEYGITDKIISSWNAVKSLFENIWPAAQEHWLKFKAILDEYGITNKIMLAWNSVKNLFESVWSVAEPHWLKFKAIIDEYNIVDNIISGWTSIKNFFANIWSVAEPHWLKFKAILDEYGIADKIISAWNFVKSLFESIWSIAEPHWLKFKAILDEYNVVDKIIFGWTFVKNFFANIWTEATTHWNSFIEKIRSLNIADKIMASWTKLKDFFKGIWNEVAPSWDKFTAPLSKIWEGAKSSVSSIGNLFRSDDQKLSSKLPPLKNNASANVNKSQNNNVTINVNASKTSDPKEVAKQVSKEMKDFNWAYLYDPVGELP